VSKLHDDAGKILAECEKISTTLKSTRSDLFNKYVEVSNKVDDFTRLTSVDLGKIKDDPSAASVKADIEKLSAKLEELNKAKQEAQTIVNDVEKQLHQVSLDFAEANKLNFEILKKATDAEAKINLNKINETLSKIKKVQEGFASFNKSFDDILKKIQSSIDETNNLLKPLKDKISAASKQSVDAVKKDLPAAGADISKPVVDASNPVVTPNQQNSIVRVIFNKTSAVVYAFSNLFIRGFTALKELISGSAKQTTANTPAVATQPPAQPVAAATAPAPQSVATQVETKPDATVKPQVEEVKWKTYTKIVFSYLLDGAEAVVKFTIKAIVATYYFLKDQVVKPFISDVQKKVAEQKQTEVAKQTTVEPKPEATKPAVV
jgi:ElaB/YqjD/DUF883 family membrane-anchored ribosome-binding protein